jgi:hypothetical protein
MTLVKTFRLTLSDISKSLTRGVSGRTIAKRGMKQFYNYFTTLNDKLATNYQSGLKCQ